MLLVGNPNEHRTVSDQFRRSNSLEHRLQSRVRMTVGAEILLGPGKSGRGSFRCALTQSRAGNCRNQSLKKICISMTSLLHTADRQHLYCVTYVKLVCKHQQSMLPSGVWQISVYQMHICMCIQYARSTAAEGLVSELAASQAGFTSSSDTNSKEPTQSPSLVS